MKIFFCLVFLFNVGFVLGREKISSQESSLLTPFFQTLIRHSETGYVLCEQKPICVEGFAKDTWYFEPTEGHQVSVAINAVKEVLKKPLFKNGKTIFLIDEAEENLIIINRKLFLRTIYDNLSLFQYVLGPSVTPESLLNALLSKKPFMEVFNSDKTLMGIVLGYGVQNALYVARIEEIEEEIFTFDVPPFTPKADKCISDFEQKILLFFPTEAERNRLALPKKKQKSHLEPSNGFASLIEEKECLSRKIGNFSKTLEEKEPYFIFGCLESETKLISSLERTQKKLQKLLTDFSLSKVLKLVTDDQIEIEPQLGNPPYSLNDEDINLAAAKLLKKNLFGYSNEYLCCFAQGLLEERENLSDSEESLLGFAESLANIKTSKKNLEAANAFFSELEKNEKVNSILEKFLYFEVVEKGDVPVLTDELEISVDYEVFDHSDRCLERQKNITIDLTQTIPGFAHGIRGMNIGETRALFIHPALAYGVHTYLEKGTYLKAVVKLLAIGSKKGKLNDLKPKSISFVCSDNFQRYCEEEHKKNLCYLGALRAEFLKKCPGIDIKKVASRFQNLTDKDDLSPNESIALNQLFWIHYFANSEACSNPSHNFLSTPDRN